MPEYKMVQMLIPVVKETSNHEWECQPALTSPFMVYEITKQFSMLAQETMNILLLNTKHQVFEAFVTTIGTIDQALCHPREIFRRAITESASAIILVHNHPSGDLTPSIDDIKITKRMVQSGEILNITVLDHIIIAPPNKKNKENYYSLRESGVVDFTV
jgi:DNA repair protein RadC